MRVTFVLYDRLSKPLLSGRTFERVMRVRDFVEARAHPTVVRLDHLEERDSAWIGESYYLTPEVTSHLDHVTRALQKSSGAGMFLIGQYGSGKSHFLAYVAQRMRSGKFPAGGGVLGGGTPLPTVKMISLVHYSSDTRLEDAVGRALEIPVAPADRRPAWTALAERHPEGVLLIIDELSEFLRSKPTTPAFNEDVRFLQFLGEWAGGNRLWILAAMQEQIEHTGEIEGALYRKIKDRYPLRFILSQAHVEKLIAESVLVKKEGYEGEVQKLVEDLLPAAQDPNILAKLGSIYPIHPATLAVLEEVRERFSQARGAIDFIVTRLRGDPARGIGAFLDEQWGSLITPDVIVDHFRDLFEIQPEFLPISQKLFPYYKQHLPDLFANEKQRELAHRVLKILIVAHLSPVRSGATAKEVADWLLMRPSRVDPSRTLDLIDRLLGELASRGRYVKKAGAHYALDLLDESGRELERLLQKELAGAQGDGDRLFEDCALVLEGEPFNPFVLARDEWQPRSLKWQFHDRTVSIFLGNGPPAERRAPAIVIRLPWGEPEGGAGLFTILPGRVERTRELIELAALIRLDRRPLPADVQAKVKERIAERKGLFHSRIRAAFSEASFFNKSGGKEPIAQSATSGATFASWLEQQELAVLRSIYPMFEAFAPRHGPLPLEALRQWMREAKTKDLTDYELSEWVKIIREAYLLPMRLMERRAREYAFPVHLDKHELITLVTTLLQTEPEPRAVYEHLEGPVYGLVPDQVHVLLTFLLVKGEIDILKGSHSYRDAFENLPNPIQYDRIVRGRALAIDQIHALQELAEGFGVKTPKQWTVLAQRRAVGELRDRLDSKASRLSEILLWVDRREDEITPILERSDRLVRAVAELRKGESELSGFERFLIAIGSTKSFIAEVAALENLPERIRRLGGDLDRFRHILSSIGTVVGIDPQISEEIEKLGNVPSLGDLELAEVWLAGAQATYGRYKKAYGARHQQYWETIQKDGRLLFTPPRVAESRHIGLEAELGARLELLEKARSKFCRGLVALDFQPKCTCGFDGERSPIEDDLVGLGGLRDQIERALTAFFRDPTIKDRVREWHKKGLERAGQTIGYLDDREGWPVVQYLRLFDEHLSGIELVREIAANEIFDELEGRIWDRASLRAAVEKRLERLGDAARLRIKRSEPPEARPAAFDALIAWSVEQALRSGTPLPGSLSASEHRRIAEIVRPEWVTEASLARLDDLKLGEPALVRVLGLIVDGSIRASFEGALAPSAAAARELVKPRAPKTHAALAKLARALYQEHARLDHVAHAAWRERLDGLARAAIEDEIPMLAEALGRREDSEWLAIDCFGIVILEDLVRDLGALFPPWRLERTSFARVPVPSTTDSFHRHLLDCGIRRSVEKVGAIDRIIHARPVPFEDLVRLAIAELRLELRPHLSRLDPMRKLTVFGDHGFRLSKDGREYVHGGSSALECTVPILDLVPSGRDQ